MAKKKKIMIFYFPICAFFRERAEALRKLIEWDCLVICDADGAFHFCVPRVYTHLTYIAFIVMLSFRSV